MPIYEYRCGDCGHEFETIQKISEAPLTLCPACDHESLKKKVSRAAFRLKGAGWYETDFKSSNKRNVAGSGDSADSGTGGKSETGSNGSSDKDSGSGAQNSGAQKSSADKSSSEKTGSEKSASTADKKATAGSSGSTPSGTTST